MARNKSKDDEMFNCSQDYELDQVASHYGSNKQQVIKMLEQACSDNLISGSTHKEVYELIEIKLKLSLHGRKN